ncbi:MAG: hypothetical protein GY850_37545 [bacterium]|nr:hypothetical protein [bacterium]
MSIGVPDGPAEKLGGRIPGGACCDPGFQGNTGFDGGYEKNLALKGPFEQIRPVQ